MKDEKTGHFYKFSISEEYRHFVRSSNGRGIKCSLGAENFDEICKRPCAYCERKRKVRPVRINRNDEKGFYLENTEAVCDLCFAVKGEISRRDYLKLVFRTAERCSAENPGMMKTVEIQKVVKREKQISKKPVREDLDIEDDFEDAEEESGDVGDGRDVSPESLAAIDARAWASFSPSEYMDSDGELQDAKKNGRWKSVEKFRALARKAGFV